MSMSALCFLLEAFVVSGLTFKSLIHLEFIFVCDVRKESHLILLHVTAVFPTPFVKEVDFPPLYILAPVVVDELPVKVWVHFWALYCIPLTYACFSSPVLDQPSDSFFFSPPSDKEAATWRARRQAGFQSISGYWTHTVCQSQARLWEPQTSEPWPLAPRSSCLADSLGPPVQYVTVDPLPPLM